MKTPPRPLPTWLEWFCWIFGSILVLGNIVGLYVAGAYAWAGTQLLREKPPKDAADWAYMLLLTYGPLLGSLFWLWVGVTLARLPGKRRRQAQAQSDPDAASTPETSVVKPRSAVMKTGKKRWHLCNVFSAAEGARHVWQFDAANGSFNLGREQTSPSGEPLPANLFGKTWTTLWQKKLNVAWLPPENVFVRVAHFPVSGGEETRAMVELQLEKLSPIPVTQAVWSLHVLPHSTGNLQTIVLVIASRSAVEEFLGKLEGQGFLADRLELPLLDQLQATPITEDGAWIYPEALGGPGTALVAWWYGGVLQTVDLLTLPAGPDRAAGLRDQLTQMAWAGELEGWLTSPPRWHLVADDAKAMEWEPALRVGLDQQIEIIAPLPTVMIASMTARRATQADVQPNLLPEEFASRYRQQFVDRLWMRGVGAAVGMYVVGLIVYFVALFVLNYQTQAVETDVKSQGPAYTNAVQLTQQYRILKERQDLKYAALDCWEAVAECLPENVTLEQMNFSEGRVLKLNGTAPKSQMKDVIDFVSRLHKHPDPKKPGQFLFDPIRGDALQTHPGPGDTVMWGFGVELKRTEER